VNSVGSAATDFNAYRSIDFSALRETGKAERRYSWQKESSEQKVFWRVAFINAGDSPSAQIEIAQSPRGGRSKPYSSSAMLLYQKGTSSRSRYLRQVPLFKLYESETTCWIAEPSFNLL
jgi:hypothetical protein